MSGLEYLPQDNGGIANGVLEQFFTKITRECQDAYGV